MRAVNPSLPGAELIAKGLADLERGAETPEALLVSMAATRLGDLGFHLPAVLTDADHRLYNCLAAVYGDAAHSRYNALVRQLVSFQHAACAS